MKGLILFGLIVLTSQLYSQALLVKDIDTRPAATIPSDGVVIGNKAYYIINQQLWVSDASEDGTHILKGLEDIVVSDRLVASNGELFFIGQDLNGPEIWKTDGTLQGTGIVIDLTPGESGSSISFSPCSCDGKVYFIKDALELWVTDGTIEGTQMLHEFAESTPVIESAICFQQKFLFIANVDFDFQLWESNGTPLGTKMAVAGWGLTNFVYDDAIIGVVGDEFVRLNNLSSLPFEIGSSSLGFKIGPIPHFTIYNGSLFFVAMNDELGMELWSYSESTGTQLIKDINEGSGSSNPTALKVSGTYLYFFANDQVHGMELWRTDGTESGTELVKDINLGSMGSAINGNANPIPSKDIILTVETGIIFIADDGIHGKELWRSDGTDIGTVLIKDFNDGTPSSIVNIEVKPQIVGNSILVFADDGINGDELFVSNGTEVGSFKVKEISPGTGNVDIRIFPVINSEKLIFSANDGSGFDLWESDGSNSGTKKYKTLNSKSSILLVPGLSQKFDDNGTHKVILSIETDEFGRELWKTDGTEIGTEIIKDLYNGPGNGAPTPSADINGTLMFFRGNDGSGIGDELFITDGTVSGTHLVKDIRFGPESSRPIGFMNIANATYFFVIDELGRSMWKSDGTELGTQRVLTFGSELDFSISTRVSYDNSVVFGFGRSDTGLEPWVSDGSSDGTKIIKDIYPGKIGSEVYDFAPLGNNIFFTANSPDYGREIWKTDGTIGGTDIFLDLIPGSNSSIYGSFGKLIGMDGHMYFSANDDTNGEELWVSDGTIEGTHLLFDLISGIEGSKPSNLTEVSGNLFFSAMHNGIRKAWVWNQMLDEPMLLGGTNPTNFALVGTRLFFLSDDDETGRELWSFQFSPGHLVGISPEPPGPEPQPEPGPVTSVTSKVDSKPKIFPNPASETIHVNANSEHLRIQVKTSLGQEFDVSTFYNQGLHNIDISALPPGLYFLLIFDDGDKIVTHRFLKQ